MSDKPKTGGPCCLAFPTTGVHSIPCQVLGPRKRARRRRHLSGLSAEELADLRAVAADPQPQDLEGLAYAVRWLLEERDRRLVAEALKRSGRLALEDYLG